MHLRLTKIFASLLTVAALSTTTTPSHAAGSVSSVRITAVSVTSSGTWAYLTFDGTITGTRPGAPCSNLTTNRFAFDPRTNEGKAFLSLATSAMLAGKTVTASGNNSCNVSTNHEDLKSFTVSG
jgi:hypothetical protein